MFPPRFGGFGFQSRGAAVLGGGFGGGRGACVDGLRGTGDFGFRELFRTGAFDSGGCDEGVYLGDGEFHGELGDSGESHPAGGLPAISSLCL